MSDTFYHQPVLLQEAVDWLAVAPGKKYIDATLGGGGHTQEIKKRGGLVLGLDQDEEAINNSGKLADRFVRTNFVHLEETVKDENWYPVAGILLDLGVSTHQLTANHRGFSYQIDGPLDMRMGNSAVTAAELVNQLSVSQLASLLKDFGEIPVAKQLAVKIIAAKPISTTSQLADICGRWSQQAFQALRIAVNDELGALEQVLPQSLRVLDKKGRLVVISFHSLEDRIVKNCFKSWTKEKLGRVLTGRPILGERQAKLRAFEKNE